MNEREFAELAAGHALHALSPEDERVFLAAREAHPEWDAEADRDAAAAAQLAETVADAAPPAGVREALLARIAEPAAVAEPAPDVTAAPARRSTSRRVGARGWFALAASVVLLVAIGVGAVLIAQQVNRPPAVVALEQIGSASDAQSAQAPLADGGVATLHWSESVGKAVLVSDGLPSIASDEAFELWYVRDGTPVSAGLFEADAAGAATALLSGSPVPGDTVAVTVEDAEGSSTGQPTTQPIVAIPTA